MNFSANHTATTKAGFSFPVLITWDGISSVRHIATIGEETFFVTPGFDPSNGECVIIRNKKGLAALLVQVMNLSPEAAAKKAASMEGANVAWDGPRNTPLSWVKEKMSVVTDRVKFSIEGKDCFFQQMKTTQTEELKSRIEKLWKKTDVLFHDFLVDTHWGDYSTTCYYECAVADLLPILEKAEKEAAQNAEAVSEKKAAELAAKFKEAKATGKPVVISQNTQIEDVKGGEMYHTVTRWAMPDGSEKTSTGSLKMD